jgi:hypothetical protein
MMTVTIIHQFGESSILEAHHGTDTAYRTCSWQAKRRCRFGDGQNKFAFSSAF